MWASLTEIGVFNEAPFLGRLFIVAQRVLSTFRWGSQFDTGHQPSKFPAGLVYMRIPLTWEGCFHHSFAKMTGDPSTYINTLICIRYLSQEGNIYRIVFLIPFSFPFPLVALMVSLSAKKKRKRTKNDTILVGYWIFRFHPHIHRFCVFFSGRVTE